MKRVALIAGLAVCALTPRAAAQEPLHMVTFAWARGDGADRCPTQAAMMSSVRARLGHDPFSLLASVSAEASVERVADRWRARLIIRDGQGAALLRRELEDGSERCDTIAGAVVLSVTLALTPPPPGTPPPAVDHERAPPVVLSVPEAPRPAQAPPPTPREPLRTSLGGEVLWGPLPDLVPGVVWRLDVPITRRVGLYGAATLNPEQRMSSDARWSFGMTRATVGLCAKGRPLSRLEIDLCAGLSLGLVHVVTFGPTPVEPGNYPWFAAQIEAHAVVNLVGPLFVDLGATASAAFVRSDFVITGFTPTSVFAQSSVGVTGVFALGVEM
ncbi:MAG: hypothetical protein U0326_30845 [Polyangiales bacterium]